MRGLERRARAVRTTGNHTREHVTRARIRLAPLLLCALLLSTLGTLLLASQPADAATRATTHAATDAHAQDTSTTSATNTDTPTDTPTNTATATATTSPSATPTPSNCTKYVLDGCVQQAISTGEANWPQKGNNWCGIATIAAITAYLNPNSSNKTQDAVASLLNSAAAVSEWSYPEPHISSAVYANISQDFGTDPRAIAEGLTLATGSQYNAIVDTSDARDATYHIIAEMVTSHQPISVVVDHGQHSVLVTGVDASGDPVSNPGSINDIHVFDPGGGDSSEGIQPSPEMTVSLPQWLYDTTAYGSYYFGKPYNANVYNGTAFDPDPSVGPYSYQQSKSNHLWIGHYVWAAPTGSGISADWEFNQNGALIAGMDNNGNEVLPSGYSGASVAMPTNPPPPPPPVQVFKTAPLPAAPPPPPPPTPTPKPTSTPLPTFTPVATATFFPTPAPLKKDDAACLLLTCVVGGVTPISAMVFGALLIMGALLLVMGVVVQMRRKRGPGASADPYAGVPVVPVLTPPHAKPAE